MYAISIASPIKLEEVISVQLALPVASTSKFRDFR